MIDPPKDTGQKSMTFRCLEVLQPLGVFYVGVMHCKDICAVADFDIRRVLQEERDVERYLGVQREYVRYYDATFPSSIILSVEERCAEYNPQTAEMKLSNYLGNDDQDSIYYPQIARVLDGQHRIAGLSDFQNGNFDVPVSLFVGLDIADQAQIFATVNLEQTKERKSLAYDLFDLAKMRSPQKSCHNVVVALDQDKTSPFYKRIKRLGAVTKGRSGETITQSTFVESLMRYISNNPKDDRDLILRKKKLPIPNADELEKFPLRGLFVEGKDLEIAKVMWNYFDAVRRRWPKAWEYGGRSLILNKTNGFRALMRVFKPAYLFTSIPGDVASSREFLKLFEKCKLNDDDFNTENFAPGSSGESELRRVLVKQMKIDV